MSIDNNKTLKKPKTGSLQFRTVIFGGFVILCVAFFFLAVSIPVAWGNGGLESVLRYAKEYLILFGLGTGVLIAVIFLATLLGLKGDDMSTLIGVLVGATLMIATIGGGIRSCNSNETSRMLAARDRITLLYDKPLRETVTALVSAHVTSLAERSQWSRLNGGAIVVDSDGTLAKESYVLTGASTAMTREEVKYIIVVKFIGNVSTGFWKRQGSTYGNFEGFASQYQFTVYQLPEQKVVVSHTFLSGDYSATENQDSLRKSVIKKLEESGFEVWWPNSVSFEW